MALGAGTLCLSGCASLELLAVGGVSYLITGKGLSDHALSYMMDEDCAFHRIITESSLCQENRLNDDDANDIMLAEVDTEELPKANEPDVVIAESDDMIAANGFQPDSLEPVQFSTAALQLSDEYTENTEIFAVVGSFNDLQHAFKRSVMYRVYNTHIIENPTGSDTLYRVVVGPLDNRELISQIPMDLEAENQPPWGLDLCIDNMMPPPCSGGFLAKN